MTFLRVFRVEIVTDSVIRGDQGFMRSEPRPRILKCRSLNAGSGLSAFLRCQIRDSVLLEEGLHRFVEILPHREGDTGRDAVALGGGGVHAGDDVKVVLGYGDDVPGIDLLSGAGELVAAVLAAEAFDQAVLDEHLYDRLEIFLGKALALGDAAERDIRILAVFCDIYHYAERVASFCRYNHISILREELFTKPIIEEG